MTFQIASLTAVISAAMALAACTVNNPPVAVTPAPVATVAPTPPVVVQPAAPPAVIVQTPAQ